MERSKNFLFYLFDGVANCQTRFFTTSEKPMFIHNVYLLQEGLPEAVGVVEDDWFVFVIAVLQGPQLVADHHLEDFVECADAARQGDEGVAVDDEVLLTLGHTADTDDLADLLRVDDLFAEECGYDGNDGAACFEGAAAYFAHQAEVAAAVEQRVAAKGYLPAQFAGAGGYLLVARLRRAAKDGDIHVYLFSIFVIACPAVVGRVAFLVGNLYWVVRGELLPDRLLQLCFAVIQAVVNVEIIRHIVIALAGTANSICFLNTCGSLD